MLVKLAIALPNAKIDDAEADARLEIYWSALRDIPLPDLRQAYDRLLKTSRFFPTIEEIRAAAHPSMAMRSEEHTSELQSLMRLSYAVFCLKKKIYSRRNQVRNKDINTHHNSRSLLVTNRQTSTELILLNQ